MVRKQKQLLFLMIGSLGVVFGDIGTSPLYALKVFFGLSHQAVTEKTTILGLISLLLWTVTLVVSIKYIVYIMRANNKGEGGIMALVSLINSSKLRRRTFFIVLGLVGVALFYGDSVITPAISVLSAVEGLDVIAPELSNAVVPITLVILVGLFVIQRFGSDLIGKLFGPIMLLWFVVIALGGLYSIVQQPEILKAVSPTVAINFIAANPLLAFVSLGAVVLAITGAEALYADMGHFGRKPIARSWFFLVFPALALCYMGQGALVIESPSAIENPFYLLFPDGLRLPVLLLATVATLIASQAVITGAYSLTRQAIQLNFLPKMTIRQTSSRSFGQIYIPFVNFVLFCLVVLLVVFFGSAEHLAVAFGIAVSGTLLVDSILFMVARYSFWHRPIKYIVLYGLVFLTVDILLLTANIPKIMHGGWLPLSIAALILVVIYTWIKGQRLVGKERRAIEIPLRDFIESLRKEPMNQLVRLPGAAIYIGHHIGLTPTALRSAVEDLHELHEKVLVVYVKTAAASHIPPEERAVFNELGYNDGIGQVTITYGFHDSPNIPKALTSIRGVSPEVDFDPEKAAYFISMSRVVVSKRRTMREWQKNLYSILHRNALSTSDYYKLPVEKTVEMRTLIKI